MNIYLVSILRSQSTWSITNHFAYRPEEKNSPYNIWTTTEYVPIDAHLIHPSYHQYMPSSLDLYRTYCHALMKLQCLLN
ncbi:unnamed protein product, partial [Rotaria magnacalcarata]